MDNTKQFKDFLKLIVKLEPIEFLGLCKVLCVQVEIEKEPRAFDSILDDVLTKFNTLGRKQRRDILKVLKNCAKAPKDFNGASTENSKTL